AAGAHPTRSAASGGAARSSSAPSEIGPALLADADLLAVVAEPVPDARGPALVAENRDVGRADRHVPVDDAGLHRRPPLSLFLLGGVYALDDDPVRVG